MDQQPFRLVETVLQREHLRQVVVGKRRSEHIAGSLVALGTGPEIGDCVMHA